MWRCVLDKSGLYLTPIVYYVCSMRVQHSQNYFNEIFKNHYSWNLDPWKLSTIRSPSKTPPTGVQLCRHYCSQDEQTHCGLLLYTQDGWWYFVWKLSTIRSPSKTPPTGVQLCRHYCSQDEQTHRGLLLCTQDGWWYSVWKLIWRMVCIPTQNISGRVCLWGAFICNTLLASPLRISEDEFACEVLSLATLCYHLKRLLN